jgi:SSS family solute:Na+ symporter
MLAARNLTNARRGAIWGSFLKVMPVFIFLVPGMLGWALHQHHAGGFAIPLDAQGGVDADKVFPSLVTQLLPVGFRGLVVAGLIAALMSSLASLFNSVSTLFTVDVYKKLRPQTSEKRLVAVGRITTVSMTALGLLWVPIMRALSGGGLYQYIQAVQSFLAPPIVAVFVTGLLWKRMNARGAVWGLGLGFALGMTKLMLNVFGVETIPDFYYSGLLLALSVLIIVISSLTAPAPETKRIESLTFATLGDDFKRENRASWNKWDVLGSLFVLGLVAAAYAYFWTWLD